MKDCFYSERFFHPSEISHSIYLRFCALYRKLPYFLDLGLSQGISSHPCSFWRLGWYFDCPLWRKPFRDSYILHFCFVYLDNVLVSFSSKSKYLDHLECIEAGLELNFEKCKFLQSQVRFLGHLITPKGIQPQAISSLPLRKVVKDLGRFFGMLNIYHRFLPKATDQGFVTTKQQLVDAKLLAFPQEDAPLTVFVDISHIAVGVALQQKVN